MPRLTALDLSLSATGLFSGDPQDPSAPFLRAEIPTPSRRDGESDVAWNGRRFDAFSGRLLGHLQDARPELLVLEVTSHAHRSMTRDAVRVATSRGQEFRAGLGLGRALGWIDGVMVLAAAYGYGPARVETIEASDAKLRVAGAQGASKAAVRAKLMELFGWRTEGWRESEVDALAVGLGWARREEMLARESRLRALAGPPLVGGPPLRRAGARGARAGRAR